MPELPEMENYKMLLTPIVTGKPITAAMIERPKSLNVAPADFIGNVSSRRIVQLHRRAKHLLFALDSGNVLLLHLMLGGWIFYGTEGERPARTAQVILSFGERNLYFFGLRLGYLHLHTMLEARQRLSQLGPEPLHPSFHEEIFQQMMSGKRGTLKTALIDQKFISGIGSCYSDEICFAAGVLPTRSIQQLTEEERSRLYVSIRSVLREAIDYGGYMEYPLFVGDVRTGKYNDRCKVYDCEGKACLRCGHPIGRTEIASRKSFFCANCQR